jgi:hypothetical protein
LPSAAILLRNLQNSAAGLGIEFEGSLPGGSKILRADDAGQQK